MSSVPHAPLSNSPSVSSQSSQGRQPRPPGYLYGGAVCRIDFWARMTSALGVTQLVIGAGCICFYLFCILVLVYSRSSIAAPLLPIDVSDVSLLHLAVVGLMTGIVISLAGVVGSVASKKKTKCTVCAFLCLSILSGVCAMFPLVIGILQAASQQNTNLLLPICELVFGTVEMVVATWSLGVCCQAICCPNITFGHVSTRPLSGYGGGGSSGSGGITHFLVSGDGQRVVLLAPQSPAPNAPGAGDGTAPAAPPPPYAYSLPAHHAPYVLQNGVTVLPLVSWPRVSGGAFVTNTSPGEKSTQTAHPPEFPADDEQAALLD